VIIFLLSRGLWMRFTDRTCLSGRKRHRFSKRIQLVRLRLFQRVCRLDLEHATVSKFIFFKMMLK
jgi:hypothetical protein